MDNLHARGIIRRIVVEGDLRLCSPAHVGNGEIGEDVDLPIARHPADGNPILRGDSIAGAMRSWLHEYQYGYGATATAAPVHALLFGGEAEDPEGALSPLIVDDALLDGEGTVERRDGVAINPQNGTAERKLKFDREFLESGQIFPLRFELVVTDKTDSALVPLLSLVLSAFEAGDIRIGARKMRGFGRAIADGWRVRTFDATTPRGIGGWLTYDDAQRLTTAAAPAADCLAAPFVLDDRRRWIDVSAEFTLNESIMIRSDSPALEDISLDDPDDVHLRSRRDGRLEYVVSGTSLAGTLRSRARRITRARGWEEGLVDSVFGFVSKTNGAASRLAVEEAVVPSAAAVPLVQARTQIEELTGGSFAGALFSEQALFAAGAPFSLSFRLRQSSQGDPDSREAALLMLLLKDLWTGDLPIGGASSIGRGTLSGQTASITRRYDRVDTRFSLRQTTAGLDGDLVLLENLCAPSGQGVAA